MTDIKNEMRSYIAENFLVGDKAARLSDDDSFLEHHILDSTGFLELITHLEERFGIKITDEEMVPENLDSLGNIESFVRRKLAIGVTAASGA